MGLYKLPERYANKIGALQIFSDIETQNTKNIIKGNLVIGKNLKVRFVGYFFNEK